MRQCSSDASPEQLRTAPTSAAALPSILRLNATHVLELPAATLYAQLSTPLRWCPGAFNPSIVAAPPLAACPMCAYLVALRVSTHDQQCGRHRKPPATGRRRTEKQAFAATAVVALDSQLRVVASTWLLNALESQLAADGAMSPDRHRVHDVRLFTIGHGLFATWHCHHCQALVAQLHVHADADRGTVRLRVWSTLWDKYRLRSTWLQGRNQALIAWPVGTPASPVANSTTTNTRAKASIHTRVDHAVDEFEVAMQPWITDVVSLGRARFRRVTMRNPFGAVPSVHTSQPALEPALTRRRLLLPKLNSPLGVVERMRWHTMASLNESSPARAHSRARGVNAHEKLAERLGAHVDALISPTAHLVQVVDDDAGGECTALLGIGHTHEPAPSAVRSRASAAGGTSDGAGRGFHWSFGINYSHFFYTLMPHPPYTMLAASHAFCLAASTANLSMAAESVCESVQFVSGIARSDSGRGVLLSYGINDCSAAIGELPLRRVWDMLLPLGSDNERACVHTVPLPLP